MTNKQKPSKDEREQRRLRRLGTSDPACGCCGEKDWRCLELHHVAGKKNDPDLVAPICRNCHRKVSDDQCDHPPDISGSDAVLARIAHFLLGLADMLVLIVEKLREFADVLFAYDASQGLCDDAAGS